MNYSPCVTVLALDGMAGSETPALRRTAEWLKLLREDCKARYKQRRQRDACYCHSLART